MPRGRPALGLKKVRNAERQSRYRKHQQERFARALEALREIETRSREVGIRQLAASVLYKEQV